MIARIFRDKRFRSLIIGIVSFVLLLLFLLITNPHKSPLIVLLIPFILLFVSLYNTILFLLNLVGRGGKVVKHARPIAIILGLEPVLLLLLASINQLTLGDFILSLVLIGGLAWYLSRSAGKT